MAVIAAIFAAVIAPIAVSASHDFVDVPDSNIFHDHISWMADAGVTQGCNPPANDMFCPGSNVTREQMAAFMRRLAENQVVDAAELMGAGPGHYSNPTYGTSCYLNSCPDTTASLDVVKILEMNVSAPEAGYFTVAGSYAGHSVDTDGYTQSWVTIDTTTDCGGWFGGPFDHIPGSWTVESVDTNVEWTNGAATTVVAATAGNHTLKLCAVGLASIDTQQASLTATFSGVGGVNALTVAPADYSMLIDGYEGVRLVE